MEKQEDAVGAFDPRCGSPQVTLAKLSTCLFLSLIRLRCYILQFALVPCLKNVNVLFFYPVTIILGDNRNAAQERRMSKEILARGGGQVLASVILQDDMQDMIDDEGLSPHLYQEDSCCSGLDGKREGWHESTWALHLTLHRVMTVKDMRRLRAMAVGALFNLSVHLVSWQNVHGAADGSIDKGKDETYEREKVFFVTNLLQDRFSTIFWIHRMNLFLAIQNKAAC